MLASNFPEHFAAVQRYQSENDGFLLESEQSILGIEHAAIGSLLGEHWHFPPTICNAIAIHHRPDDSEKDFLAGIVHIADALAHARRPDGEPDRNGAVYFAGLLESGWIVLER